MMVLSEAIPVSAGGPLVRVGVRARTSEVADQPRHPSGSPEGGQFAPGSGRGPTAAKDLEERRASRRAAQQRYRTKRSEQADTELRKYFPDPKRIEPTAQESEGVSGRLKPHACYDETGRYLTYSDRGDAKLVHGIMSVHGIPVGHAWVELPGNKVFDGVQGRFYDKDSYYEAYGAKAEHVYTADETRRMMLKHKTYGPWERTDGIFFGIGSGDIPEWQGPRFRRRS